MRFIAAIGVLLAAATADAQSFGERLMKYGRTLGYAELIVPDLRLVLDGDATEVALAWPLLVAIDQVRFGIDPETGFRICGDCAEVGNALYLNLFLEPQWAPVTANAQGLFGFRTLLHRDALFPISFAIDAGGAGGTRGVGAFVGAFAGVEVLGIALLGGTRRMWLSEGAHWELSVDLMVPMQWLPGAG